MRTAKVKEFCGASTTRQSSTCYQAVKKLCAGGFWILFIRQRRDSERIFRRLSRESFTRDQLASRSKLAPPTIGISCIASGPIGFGYSKSILAPDKAISRQSFTAWP